MKDAGHIEGTEGMRNAYKISIGKHQRKTPLEIPSHKGMIILKCMLEKEEVNI
jgi:hypothetical protein